MVFPVKRAWVAVAAKVNKAAGRKDGETTALLILAKILFDFLHNNNIHKQNFPLLSKDSYVEFFLPSRIPFRLLRYPFYMREEIQRLLMLVFMTD